MPKDGHARDLKETDAITTIIITSAAKSIFKSAIYMLGAKHGFVQSVDCAAQIVDPYFARAIHGLRSHSVRIHLNCAR